MNPLIISFQLMVHFREAGYRNLELRCPWDGKPLPRVGELVVFDGLKHDMKGEVINIVHFQSVERPTEVYVRRDHSYRHELHWFGPEVEDLLAAYQKKAKG